MCIIIRTPFRTHNLCLKWRSSSSSGFSWWVSDRWSVRLTDRKIDFSVTVNSSSHILPWDLRQDQEDTRVVKISFLCCVARDTLKDKIRNSIAWRSSEYRCCSFTERTSSGSDVCFRCRVMQKNLYHNILLFFHDSCAPNIYVQVKKNGVMEQFFLA